MNLKRAFCLDHRIEDHKDPSHAFSQSNFCRFPGLNEPLIKGFDCAVVPKGRDQTTAYRLMGIFLSSRLLHQKLQGG